MCHSDELHPERSRRKSEEECQTNYYSVNPHCVRNHSSIGLARYIEGEQSGLAMGILRFTRDDILSDDQIRQGWFEVLIIATE
jgi:hypothetical protein